MNTGLEMFQERTKSWFEKEIGSPTQVQIQGWSRIAKGRNVLISAPTGTGKTLSSFLVFIDSLKQKAAEGTLEDRLYVIYISPLKSLANDIEKNLQRPLMGIGGAEISVAIRTGDTTSKERQKMLRKPPHILITTPESLYLLITSKGGRKMLKNAETVIIDEIHALINGKRGAHLMLTLARLDILCKDWGGSFLQRIGLSATVQPLDKAAEYLSLEGADIIAPKIEKPFRIEINSPVELAIPSSVWPLIAEKVYGYAMEVRTVIAFTESRAQAENLSYHINRIGGDGFSRTHHGCVSKEQRLIAEQQLKKGELKVLCATSSMELGIDVGEVEKVVQIGAPRTVSQTLQRLGRAGHNPGRTSIMHMLPKTDSDSVYCLLNAGLAAQGRIENLNPPEKCLDVLAQHIVSMSAAAMDTELTVAEIMEVLSRAYNFRNVTEEEVIGVLEMLAGDFEHEADIPVRPRILYDRINGCFTGDNYSRMLAVTAVGTIPDRGMYDVRLSDGTKIGELDEEYVFEARVGDKFLLGAFSWRISKIQRDRVIAAPASIEGAVSPFWRGDRTERDYGTSLEFGSMLREFTTAYREERLFDELKRQRIYVDDYVAHTIINFLGRQIESTGILPDDKTIIAEYLEEEAGQMLMLHSVFGGKVNGPLSVLLADRAKRETGGDFYVYYDDDGIMLLAGGSYQVPRDIIYRLDNEEKILETALPVTPMFGIAFRHNAGRALMFGAGTGKRQPLWIQRLKGAKVLDNVVLNKKHPLMEETKRDILENFWDMNAFRQVIARIKSGDISVKEIDNDSASPMSIPLKRQIEGEQMYSYYPATEKVVKAGMGITEQELRADEAALKNTEYTISSPKDSRALHSVLMTEGDLTPEDVEAPVQWFEELAENARAYYIEPGLWICAEYMEDYQELNNGSVPAREKIVRRCLRYRGGQSVGGISQRYAWSEEESREILDLLVKNNSAVEDGDIYYHGEVYKRAQQETVMARRREITTKPSYKYAEIIIKQMELDRVSEPMEQLRKAITPLWGIPVKAALWEGTVLPTRVTGYRGELLDRFLAQGEVYWGFETGGENIVFNNYEDIDWSSGFLADSAELAGDELLIAEALKERGAVFAGTLGSVIEGRQPLKVLMGLAEKGLVHSDSFSSVRYWLNRDKITDVKRNARAVAGMAASGRFELSRPTKAKSTDWRIKEALKRGIILTKETAADIIWQEATEILRIWEFAGVVRRGYFIKGLSGAQYTDSQDFDKTINRLECPDSTDITWLSAQDPMQLFGKILPHDTGREFALMQSSTVCFLGGKPVMVFEKGGKVLRVFEGWDEWGEECLVRFKKAYEGKRIYTGARKIEVKKYPPETESILKKAGFSKQVSDYVIWQSIW